MLKKDKLHYWVYADICYSRLLFTLVTMTNVALPEQLSGDIHEEVESHNHMLDRMVCIFLYSVLTC